MAVKFNPFTGNLDLIDTTAAAGSNTQVQFNSGGLLDGSADLTWDDTGKVLDIGGDVNLDDGGSFTTTLQTITPTANRTISFPDATGTLALVAGSSGQFIYNNAGAYGGVSTMTFDGTSVTLAGRLINSYTSLASSPAKTFTGTWFTGGTATTTKPHVLVEPTGTTSTAWSTSGTGLGVNAASGFTGNLLDLQVNGTSQFRVRNDGGIDGTDLVFRKEGNGFCFFSKGTSRTPLWFAGWFSPLKFSAEVGITWTNSVSSATGGTDDLIILRDAAGTLAQRNGTNAQTFRVYNTYTSGTSYELGKLEWSSNVFRIGTEKGSGGGTARALELQTDGITRVQISRDGVYRYVQGAPAAVNTTANLTIANLQGGIITTTTAAAVDMTLPTGTDVEGGFAVNRNDLTFMWSVINTGSNAATVLANTDHTIVGAAAVAAGTSGRFATRRTAANTYVTYRLS